MIFSSQAAMKDIGWSGSLTADGVAGRSKRKSARHPAKLSRFIKSIRTKP